MEKQLKDLCIRAGQGENLEACLNGYTKPQIRRILDVYGRKAVSSAKKQELIDAAEEAVRENAIAWLEKRGERGGQDDSEGDIRSAGAYF